MSVDRPLSISEIREIGEALYGPVWQVEMAKALGVPRQSIAYYLKAGGVRGAQASAIIGLVARIAARELRTARERQADVESRQADLARLLHRLEAAAT